MIKCLATRVLKLCSYDFDLHKLRMMSQMMEGIATSTTKIPRSTLCIMEYRTHTDTSHMHAHMCAHTHTRLQDYPMAKAPAEFVISLLLQLGMVSKLYKYLL